MRGDDVVALTARGVVDLADGAPNAARRYFARAHELAGSPVTALNLAAALLTLGRAEVARDLLRPFAADGAPPELFANLAFAEWSSGEAEPARATLERALDAGVDPRNPRVVALQRLLAVPVDAR